MFFYILLTLLKYWLITFIPYFVVSVEDPCVLRAESGQAQRDSTLLCQRQLLGCSSGLRHRFVRDLPASMLQLNLLRRFPTHFRRQGVIKKFRLNDTQSNALRFVGTFGLFFVLICMQGKAQTTQGSVFGTVRDASGAAISGATATLTNLDEGVSRTATTNSTGNYVFLDAVAAHYTLTVAAPGFETFQASKVVLEVRQQLRIDATLTVGTVKQQVVVNGDTVSDIQTDSPTISGTFTASDAEDLPVNTRASASGTSAAAILGVLPGAQDDQSGISIQGALPFETDVTIDGITVKNAQGGTWINDAFPSTEAISEIRVDGVLASAEYGDPGQVVVTTKSGTNHFHGSAFTYYQDNNWNAHAYSYTPYTQPSYHGTTFGGSLGGPVILPHYNGRDRSFFFADYEGWRFPSQAVLQEVVPTQAMMQGDFSGYTDSQGKTISLRDPYNPTQSWGTQVPSGNISKIAAATLKQFYPTPNIGNPNTYQDGETANWTENVDASKHSDQFDVRGDQYFGTNQKFLLWGKFT